jgi:hypothetical protein
MLPDPTDMMAIAHHEAGHAVINKVLGFKIHAVTFNRVWFSPRSDMGPMTRQDLAITYIAGPEAERRYGDYSLDRCVELWGTYWQSDLSNAERHLRGIGISMQKIEDMARQHVERHWGWIERVAQALNCWRELAPFELEGLRRQQCARRPP